MSKVRYTACPACREAVRRGIRRFGPPKAVCDRCDHTFNTGLLDWTAMSTTEKVVRGAIEWFFPSYLSGFPIFPERLLLLVAHWIIVAVPLGLILAAATRSVGPLVLVVLPALQALWLYRMIRECVVYQQTGTPPRWRGYAG